MYQQTSFSNPAQQLNAYQPLILRALIIDTEAHFKSELSGFLRNLGHLVVDADTAHDGLDLLNHNKFDLVFLDFSLPDCEGLDLLTQIKDKCPGIEVVVVYNYSDMHSVLRAMALGAIDYLEKPLRQFDINITMERIEKFMRIHDKINQVEESNIMIRKNLDELLRNPKI